MTTTYHHYHTGFVFLLLLFVPVLSGCGDNRAPAKVTGTVTLDGSPVASAIVTFAPDNDGRLSYGFTDAQGRYKLRFTAQLNGTLVGTHQVRINTGDGIPPEQGGIPETIPAKYNKASELTATVKSGNNTVNFDLTSD